MSSHSVFLSCGKGESWHEEVRPCVAKPPNAFMLIKAKMLKPNSTSTSVLGQNCVFSVKLVESAPTLNLHKVTVICAFHSLSHDERTNLKNVKDFVTLHVTSTVEFA